MDVICETYSLELLTIISEEIKKTRRIMTEMNNIPRTSDEYFEDIRPYLDEEVRENLKELLEVDEIKAIVNGLILNNISEQELAKQVDSIDSVNDFKKLFLAPVAREIQKRSTFSLTSSGRSNLDKSGEEKYLFISNHRDIILDSAFLNVILMERGLSLPRVAIGDNLLIKPWIKSLVRMGSAFIVKRKPSIREKIVESRRLSMYIRSSIMYKEESVWLSQSEGRRKNSDDRTQFGVLRMLTLSSEDKDIAKALAPLNITPVSITYEFDPCDYLKAQEMLQKEINPEWQKSPMDDMINMQTGLQGQKGRVHFAITPPLTDLSSITARAEDKKQEIQMIADEIDRQIFLNYRFYPSNYAAYDLLYGGTTFKDMYSTKERANFELYLENQIDKVRVDGKKDSAFLLKKLLEMYSTPLKNHLLAKKELR